MGIDMKAIGYIVAGIIGLFLRTIISKLNGWEYTIDGHDIIVAVACITAVWSFKGVFFPQEKGGKKRETTRRKTGSIDDTAGACRESGYFAPDASEVRTRKAKH